MKTDPNKRRKILYFIFHFVKLAVFCFVSYAMYVILTSSEPSSSVEKKPDTRNSEKLVLINTEKTEEASSAMASNLKTMNYVPSSAGVASVDRSVSRKVSRNVTRTVVRDRYPPHGDMAISGVASGSLATVDRSKDDSEPVSRAK